ncbi:MAG: NAD kinase [Prevotella sp.]|nr:NAD kinase [Prevotella sp.]
MKRDHLRFAVFGNEYQPEKSASVYRLFKYLHGMGAVISVDRAFYDFLKESTQLNASHSEEPLFPDVEVFDGSSFEADFVISMGGDGTFLKAANRVGDKGIPIVGVNMGRLGFLADVLPIEIEQAFHALTTGDYSIEEHAVIMCDAGYALNDIAVLKRDSASMISIRTSVNGEYLVTYQADGLVVSTPTGSTAYNLSNGGPIMVPRTGVLCLTPVAPHSLNIRPIVVNDDTVIELEVESRSRNFLVAIDGRSEKLEQGTKVIIRKAPYMVKVVTRHNQRYFSTLREKMMWGADKR